MKKKLPFALCIMIFVFVAAMWMLGKDFSQLELYIRVLIAVGASALSGSIYLAMVFMDREKEEKTQN